MSKARFRARQATLALALGCAALWPALARDASELRIASEGARPPYNFIDANNELAGFEIDLGREICARLKVTCTFLQQDWDAMIPGLVSDHYDAIMAAMEINDERRAQIDFSKPYVRMPQSFAAARKRKILDESALKGRIIGVEQNTPQQAWLEENYKDAQITPFASLEEAMLELANGRIDALLGDKLAIDDFLKNRKEAACCKFLADAPRDPALLGEGIGIGLRKEDGDLKATLDTAIADIVADGTFAKIRSKYFDFEVY